MNPRIARAIMVFCDMMNGYRGREISQALFNGIVLLPFMFTIMFILVVLS